MLRFERRIPRPGGPRDGPIHDLVNTYYDVCAEFGARPFGKSKYLDSDFKPIGVTPDSNYVPTDMSGEAMFNGLKKGIKNLVLVNDQILLRLQDLVDLEWGKLFVELDPWSFWQAIDYLTMDKSPGFPFFYWTSTKQEAIIAFWDGTIKEWTVRLLRGDTSVPVVCSATLKTELREQAKVDAKKTRIFMSSPIHHVIVGNILFGAQNSAMNSTANLLIHPCTIGISLPGKPFINMLYKLEDIFPGCGFDGDVGSWDFSLLIAIMAVVKAVRKKYLPLELHAAVDAYYDSTASGWVFINGLLAWVNSQKSGTTNTGNDNSMILYAHFALAFLCLKQLNQPDLPDNAFRKLVKIFVNGDDNVLSVSPDIVSWFNIVTISQFFGKELNIELTSSHPAPRPGPDLIYLSHTLVERYVPYLRRKITCAVGRVDRSVCALRYFTDADPGLQLARLIGIGMTLWPIKDVYDKFQAQFYRWVREHEVVGASSPLWELASKMIPTDQLMVSIHCGYESLPSLLMYYRQVLGSAHCPSDVAKMLWSVFSIFCASHNDIRCLKSCISPDKTNGPPKEQVKKRHNQGAPFALTFSQSE